MAPNWLLRVLRYGITDIDGEHAASGDRTLAAGGDRTLAAARLVLAVLGVVAYTLDPPETPQWFAGFLAPILAGFLTYSVLLMFVARVRPFVVLGRGVLLHLVDLAWIVAFVTVSDGANSPFIVLLVYAMLSASYRWGLRATLLTAAFGFVMLATEGYLGNVWPLSDERVHLNAILVRGTYFAVAAVLIGLLADEERRERLRSRTAARIMSRVRTESGMVASVRAVFDDLFPRLAASRGLLILHEDDAEVASLWHTRRTAGSRVEVRLKQETLASCAPLMFPLPAMVEAFKIRRTAPPNSPIAALDHDGVRCACQHAAAAALLDAPFAWDTALCVSQLSGQGWRGRLFVFDPERSNDHDLRFLQVVVRQVTPALFNLYLQRRLRSRSGGLDRMRIAEELHDGVIQSLIGLEMELEVLCRGAHADSTRRDLERIQRVLGQEILAVRDLMHTLKSTDVEPGRLLDHLADMLEHFRHRTGIDARLANNLDEIDLPRRICNEIVRVVQEALANVRKHSGASNVLVQFTGADGDVQLVIEDNGSGFGFDGRLTDAELDARRLCPMILRERVVAIGGRLAIESSPGRGARLEITIPR